MAEDIVSLELIINFFQEHGKSISHEQAMDMLLNMESQVVGKLKQFPNEYISRQQDREINMFVKSITNDIVFKNNVKAFIVNKISPIETERMEIILPYIISMTLIDMIQKEMIPV